jgi:hypothetical protein
MDAARRKEPGSAPVVSMEATIYANLGTLMATLATEIRC